MNGTFVTVWIGESNISGGFRITFDSKTEDKVIAFCTDFSCFFTVDCPISWFVPNSFPIFELMTCFHEFSKHESTNFFTNISQLKKQTNFWVFEKMKTNNLFVTSKNQNHEFTNSPIHESKVLHKGEESLLKPLFEVVLFLIYYFIKTF